MCGALADCRNGLQGVSAATRPAYGAAVATFDDVRAVALALPGAVLGVRVGDEGAKQALLADEPAAFTTSHFDGYPVVLLRLDDVGPDELVELVVEAWADRAPAAAVREHLGRPR